MKSEGGWIGLLEGVALYGRSLSAEEVRADSAAYRRRIGTRTPAPRIEVEAKLVARSTTPAPKETVYDRGYTVFEYERVGPPAASGKDLPDRFRVAHWAEMENRCLEVAGRREGLVYRLELEQLDDNPQMEEEQVFDTLEEDLDLTVYYDIGPLGFAAREP